MKNSLMVTIDLCRGVATSRAASILGMEGEVVLPLVTIDPPKEANQVRAEDPAICLSSEIFDEEWETRLACGEARHTGAGFLPELHAAMADRPLWDTENSRAAPEPERPRRQLLRPHQLRLSRAKFDEAKLQPWAGSKVEPWEAGARSGGDGS